MVCLLPFKANTAKQSHGAGRGQAGRQTDSWPRPPSQAATNQTQRRRRATTPTVLWLALMGLNLQQKVVAWLSIAFFCSLVLIEGRGLVIGGRRGGKNLPTGGGVLTNQHKKKLQNKYNLICLRRGRKIFTYKINKVMNGGTNWRQKNWDKHVKREKVDGRNEHKTNLWR